MPSIDFDRMKPLSDRYIVVFRDEVSAPESDVFDFTRFHGISPDFVYGSAFKGFAGIIPLERLERIRKDPRVAFVSEDRKVSIERHRSSPTPAPASTQITPTGIDRINAEPSSARPNTGAGINVAVLDTGIDLRHPDLAANIAGGKNCASGAGYGDRNGHGTHAAGIIGAINNNVGIVGVAPNVKLWSVRVLDSSGSGTWSSVICGIDFVTSKAPANGGSITVANMSLGGTGSSDNNCGNTNSDALHKAICRSRDAGVTYVVAAGNESDNANNHVPAAYDDAVITVSALADSNGTFGGGGPSTSYGADDTFASFSNYGPGVDIAAPGVNILSTWKGGTYNTISGTSMATPHVTGAAALYIATHPGSSWAIIRDALKSLGEPLGIDRTDPSGLHPEPVLRADTL